MSASKTFSKVEEFDDLKKHINLVVLELNEKMEACMEDFELFPTQFQIMWKSNFDLKLHTEV